MTTTTARRWSDLPELFLDLVARRLSLDDHMRFGLVCKSWRSAATAAPPCPQPQWLLSSLRCDSGGLLCYSIWEDRTIRIRLPLGTIGMWCRAASYGWLFMAAPHGPELCLLNPVTRARIDLPPRPNQYSLWDSAALSSDPATGDRVVVVLNYLRSTYVCRVGDRYWTILCTSPDGITYVAFHKGLLHIIEDGDTLVPHHLDYIECRIVPRWFDHGWNRTCYLIDGGHEGADLLQVLVDRSGCVVLKLVAGKDGSSQQWIQVKNLWGGALFVSKGHSELVSADVCATMGMTGDHVYELNQHTLLYKMSLKYGREPTAIDYRRLAPTGNLPWFGLWFNPRTPSPLNRRKRVEQTEHSLSFKKEEKEVNPTLPPC